MLRFTLLTTLLASTLSTMAQHTVQFRIRSLPAYHPASSAIYLAGSMNGWNPAAVNYRFETDEAGSYQLTLQLKDGPIEYKLTRGNWEKGECGAGGTAVGNRQLNVQADTTIELSVSEWQDRFPVKPRPSTASANVHVLDTAFWIPQLKRTRRVWIYLPPNYQTSGTRYPVLYMQDGQNLFDDATSFSGEWGVDETMDTTENPCIVVGIDHGGARRLQEYNPYDHAEFGRGEGKAYTDFIVQTLKPYIDSHYRTAPGRANTGIAGSSMGGLISLYAVLAYPDVFGTAGVFSPALWIADPSIYDAIRARAAEVYARIYFYAGKEESEQMVPDLLRAFETMAGKSSSQLTTVIRDGARHNEAAWRKEFPAFYRWAMRENN